MTDIGITTRGIPEAIAYINQVGYMSQQKCAEWIAHYIIGDEDGSTGGEAWHGLRHYPAFRAWPGGQQYPQRTGKLQRGWVASAAAANAWKISNAVPYSKWVQGNDTQTWRAKYGNWRTISDIASTNIRGAIRFASQNLARLLKGQG